jgi:nucleotide-binding universal stress UspA family protein
MTRRILVALDETQASRTAAEFVNEFFGDLDVEVCALNVARLPIMWYPGYGYPFGVVAPYQFEITQEVRESEGADREAVQHRAERVIAESGIEVDAADIEFGDPVDAIQEAADERRVDMIVVGSSDKGWWQRLIDGSVSREMVRTADRPVLVVR